MKGLYICFENIDDNKAIGVTNKVLDQVTSFRKHSVDMKLVIFKGIDIIEICGEKKNKLYSFKDDEKGKKRIMLYYLKKIIMQEEIDIIYIRYTLLDFAFVKFLKSIRKKNNKIIIEIPTYPYDNELKNNKNIIVKFLWRLDIILRKKLKKYIDFIVTFSQDKYIFGVKTIRLQNGINVNRINKKVDKKNNKNLVLLAVANLTFWNGYDRLIYGLSEYYENNGAKNIIFNIVGEGAELENLKNLVHKLALEDKVNFKGVKRNDKLDEEFNEADIAIGSLGIHRLGLKNASTLKLKEYCARRIPFIYAYNDKCFDENLNFLLHFEENDNYINIEKIIQFNFNIQQSNYKEEMDRYCKKISWDNEIKKIISKL